MFLLPGIFIAVGFLSVSQKYLESLDRMTTTPCPSSNVDNCWLIRPATLEDADAANRLLYHCYSTILPRRYSAEILKGALVHITSARHQLLTCGTWYLALHPETREVVGCGGWTRRKPQLANSTNTTAKADDNNNINTNSEDPPQHESPPPPQLRHFATSPNWTRRGVASAIWRQVEQDMKTHSDLIGVTSFVVLSALTGEAFYASRGFVATERTEVRLGEDCLFPIVVMRREKSTGVC
jgi:hypothetical protein